MIRTAALTLLVLAGLLLPPGGASAADTLAGRVASAVAGKQGKSLQVSIGVWDAKTGETLHETNASVARRTASVMKVATTAAALLAFGPKHELATTVFATSRPGEDGVLDGDLVVRGGGDPGINNRDGASAEATMRAMAKSVRAAGVKSVGGNLVLDDTAFFGPMRHPGWQWADGEWDWYMAPVSSILLTDACVELTVLPGAGEGASAVLSMKPVTQAVRFVNRVTTGPSSEKKTTVALGRSDGAGTIPVTGRVPAGSGGYSTEAACVDPAEHFGDVFLRLLREEGVSLKGTAVVIRNPGGTAGPRVVSADPSELFPLARHATTVLDTVRVANKHSQNLYAELLLRALGRTVEDGSFEGGARVVRSVLGFAAGDTSFRQVDGSGLARENQMTAGAAGRILLKMYGSRVAKEFLASLPGPAEPDSTLRDRFRGAKYEGRVFAKTGTLRDTKSLAGYVRGQSGRTYAFAVLCEGDNGRARDLQDDVVDALIAE